MAITRYPEILFVVLCILLLCYRIWHRRVYNTSLPTNWPLIGMMPGLFLNANRVPNYATEIFQASGCTFLFKGPWFTNMDMLFTCDPANVHYILSKKFSNFGKGPAFNELFDILGDGIFNADQELWEGQRKMAMSLLSDPGFQKFSTATMWNKVEKGLIPVLDHVAGLGTVVDLQGLIERLTFDTTCILVLGNDPGCLAIDLPRVPSEKAFSDIEEAVFFRHMMPQWLWKLQRWLQIGKEKKLVEAVVVVDQFLSHCISSKREELTKSRKSQMFEDQGNHFDLLTAYLKAFEGKSSPSGDHSDKFIRDTILNLVFAGRDTVGAALTWFFWLISTNPLEENKIREEIITNSHSKDGRWSFHDAEELKKLTYLHAALCESLRLYPPVVLQHKAPHEADILPSGHRLSRYAKTIISVYSMGRMETIWGKDCLEFKPERWISQQGGIKHVPSYKFTAFNAGPRSCLGREMSFVEMKIVAATVLYNYNIHVVKGQSVCASDSVICHMKHGLNVRVTRRSV
ncbi:alkane hydroxylase MAH1-like [Cornus florida]|uniref:alkane hydroxylase MAH1-like n=1 Tax=Cornus florida TaxID=4283 RepID=UPI0028A1CEC8|nr:alkane hydroxylase MAH1-like [Cornus florida]